MNHGPFDFLGPAADFNLDGHVDSFEAGLFFHMMDMEEEMSRRTHPSVRFDEDLDSDLDDDFDSEDLDF